MGGDAALGLVRLGVPVIATVARLLVGAGPATGSIALAMGLSVRPDTRGEHASAASASGIQFGSPPHAWGARMSLSDSTTHSGSPPHAWGALRDRARVALELRFTPTRVGSTGGRVPCGPAIPVHPHTRGEHSKSRSRRTPTDGSPPHAWGALLGVRLPIQHIRFTPTRVGSTCSWAGGADPATVHPHTRGEHNTITAIVAAAHGSPPHAWGAHRDRQCRTHFARFTPTRVGSTTHRSMVWSLPTVHPHTRGEHP